MALKQPKDNSKVWRWAIILPSFVLIIGLEVLIGWQIDNQYMKSIVPGLITMNPMTCVCLMLLAVACLGRVFNKTPVVVTCATIAALVGVIKLFSLTSGYHIPIDEYIFRDKLNNTYQGLPSRIAFNTALNFVLTGLALNVSVFHHPKLQKLKQVLSIASIALAVIALNGYLYGIKSLYGLGSYLPMALHTACSFLILNIALLLPTTISPKWLKRGNMRREIIVGLVLMLIVFVGVNALVIKNIRNQALSGQRVDTEYAQILKLQETLLVLQDAETGQRGYILTGQVSYLEPYIAAQKKLPKLHEELAAELGDHADVRPLKKLEMQKMSELEQTIQLEREGKHDQALALINTNRGERTMDNLRTEIATIIAQQRETLNREKIAETTTSYNTSLLATLGTVSTVFLLGSVYYLLLKQMRHQSSERKRIEKLVAQRTKSLQSEEARLAAAIESLSYGFAIVDIDQTVVSSNMALRKLIEQDVVSVAAIDTFLHKSGKLSAQINKSILRQKQSGIIKSQVGSKHVHVNIYPIVATHKVYGAVITAEDVSDKLALERSRDEFFSIASHELRTPLTAISGNISLLLTMYPGLVKDSDARELLEDAHAGSKRMIETVNAYLDLSSLEQGKVHFKPENVELSTVLAEQIEIFKPIADDTVQIKSDMPDSIVVTADLARLKQVIAIVMNNACIYTSEGSITVATHVNDDQAVITITDTGIGIPLEQQHLVFKKFQQASGNILTRTSTHSNGLSLYRAKMLMSGMHGDILLEASSAGKGASFMLTLPIAHD